MRTIVQSNMLLRAQTELPLGLRLATSNFRDGWNIVRTAGARRLEKKIVTQGWKFLRISDTSLVSGVGATSEEAVANALKLALRVLNDHLNAVEVGHIQLTRYPWFILARVRICPCRIQQSATVSLLAAAESSTTPRRQRRLPPQSAALHPQFASALPQLRQMLTSSPVAQIGPQ